MFIILKNAARCEECGTEVESKSTHDFQQCKCGNTFVDGGLAYLRGGARNFTTVTSLIEYYLVPDRDMPA